MKRLLVFTLLLTLLTFNVSAKDGEITVTGNAEGMFLSSETNVSQDYSALKEQVLNAWRNVEGSVDVWDLNLTFNQDELTNVLAELYYSNPKLFYVTTAFKYWYSEDKLSQIDFTYRITDKDEIARINSRIED